LTTATVKKALINAIIFMSTDNEIKSLVALLDDPDPFIHQNVKSKLMELGERAVPLLDEQKSNTADNEEKQLINEIIHSITFGSLLEDYKELMESGINSLQQLEKAVLTLARLDNPTLRVREYQQKLDVMADVLKNQVEYSINVREKMNTVLHFVFDDLNFRGDTDDYHNPENAFMNRVIERRKGLPISLALIIMGIGYRLELPFYGINMPIHFILGYDYGKQSLMIDPFDKGKVITYNQCYQFLKRNGIQPKPYYFEPASEIEILLRCIRNLIHSYSKRQNKRRLNELHQFLEITETC